MKKTIIGGMLILVSASVAAHPFNERYDSRGECEHAQALVNHFDRDNVAGPVFHIDNNGEAQVFFLESFQCEVEESTSLWRMVDHRGDDSALGNAWDE